MKSVNVFVISVTLVTMVSITVSGLYRFSNADTIGANRALLILPQQLKTVLPVHHIQKFLQKLCVLVGERAALLQLDEELQGVLQLQVPLGESVHRFADEADGPQIVVSESPRNIVECFPVPQILAGRSKQRRIYLHQSFSSSNLGGRVG